MVFGTDGSLVAEMDLCWTCMQRGIQRSDCGVRRRLSVGISLFVSPNARKYDFKVCEQYREEEEELVSALDKSLKLEENWCMKVELCI